MATSSFYRKIEIKDKKAVNKFYEILTSPSEKSTPKYDADKEISEGIKALKKAFTNT